MPDLFALVGTLRELNEKYPRPGLPPLEMSPPYDIQLDFSKSFPNAEKPGVYILLDENKNVLRIGKASCKRILGQRLNDYFGWAEGRKGGVARDERFKTVRYIVTIPVPLDRAFEAPAVEEYLIDQLEPELNDQGK